MYPLRKNYSFKKEFPNGILDSMVYRNAQSVDVTVVVPVYYNIDKNRDRYLNSNIAMVTQLLKKAVSNARDLKLLCMTPKYNDIEASSWV